MNTEKHFKIIEEETRKVYHLAEEARALGKDPVSKVEIPLAMSMAEKVVGLISAVYPQMEGSKIDVRILELEKEYGKLDTMVAFVIAEEVAKQKFCKFATLLEAIEAGIRIGFAYITLGVVSSPIEGFTGLKLKKTKNGEEYFDAYFSGPIRSAGTTASCVVLMIIDYLREIFGYAKYDPSEDEMKRYFTENRDYHDRVTNLQYMPTEEEAMFLAKNIPIQLSGDPTEKFEVSNYKNLERVDSNRIRGGMCLIFSEGLAQKAAKGFRLLNKVKRDGIKSTGFDFLKEYIELHEKREVGKTDDSPTYIKDLVAGRPIFGHPSRSGSFRFRYGRSRVSGFSSFSLHPATMAITDNFIAVGTQLKLEKPTKGGVATVCDSIDGPIVKLFNGSVKKISDVNEAREIYRDVEEIIYLGDMLFPFSDVINRNANLIRPGYVEEIWGLELKEKDLEMGKRINAFEIGFEEAVEISRKTKISLNPKFIFYWNQINKEGFENLLEWFSRAKIEDKIILSFTKSEQEKYSLGKRALELLGVEHQVSTEHVIIDFETSKMLLANLGVNENGLKKLKEIYREKNFTEEDVLKIVNELSEFEIRDKAGEFIGARMGRPEKAKLRKLTGSPNVLFVVGKEGGRLRSVNAAREEGFVSGDFSVFYCESCKKETIYPSCENCKAQTQKMHYCRSCKETSLKKCGKHEEDSQNHYYRKINMEHYFGKAKEVLGLKNHEIPQLIKGIRGTSSASRRVENLAKGILRARFDLQVNKDGTIRFDATELAIVSFKPQEIGVGVEKLKELGYDKDIEGKELVSEDQILELMPHDIILPSPPDFPESRADRIFLGISGFVDELLERFYNMKPFYNLKKREDLVGHLGVCMAPHNCAGVICRIIGFSNALGLYASPYMHAAIRRDCDGDEAAVMLLGDVLLNFSREFLPGHRGGTQDAPLVLNAKIDAGEVDDQILDFEVIDIKDKSYPLDLYKKAEQKKHSSEVKVLDVRELLKQGKNPFVGLGFTHDTTDFNGGVVCSSYKILPTMKDKVKHQMELVERIRAVDTSDTARLIIERHFLRDMRGNLRNFAMQGFRCVACNEVMRRPPLAGNCIKCRGKIIFTTHEGGIKKYLEPALNLAEKYHLSDYIKQSLELTKRHIDSVFGKEPETQENLGKWF